MVVAEREEGGFGVDMTGWREGPESLRRARGGVKAEDGRYVGGERWVVGIHGECLREIRVRFFFLNIRLIRKKIASPCMYIGRREDD